MSWLDKSRPSFTHVSTHQTHVGKALYEHAPNCATIAAVACMSSSLLKSSLGPNLLALIQIDDGTFDLFDKIFLEYNPHMQLTQKLVVYVDVDKSEQFIKKLKSNGPLFSSSLQHATVYSECLPMLCGFRSLRSLTLSNIAKRLHLAILTSLPSLSELKLLDCFNFDAALFKALGELENNRNFTSLDTSACWITSWCSEGFRKDFCGRLLSKDRLTKLKFPPNDWDFMNEEDEEAFVKVGMTNLVELGECVPAKMIRGEGFENLRILSVGGATDENLVNIGNHCLFLEVLDAGGDMTGSFLNDNNLIEESFKLLRELKLGRAYFSDSDVGTGFSRLLALSVISITTTVIFTGSGLQHLPYPGQLRSVYISDVNFSMHNLLRFVNLEELEFCYVDVSREDILSFAQFKQLKRVTLGICGENCASSAPFRICPQLPNLEKLFCFGSEASNWIEKDVEAILSECKNLREFVFDFKGDGQKVSSQLEKKYPWVSMRGTLQKNKTVKKKRGARREREE